MSDFYLSIGQSVEFSKTVSETDVYLFAGITGDLALHVNQKAMEPSAYGQRIAHGALLGFHVHNVDRDGRSGELGEAVSWDLTASGSWTPVFFAIR